MDFPSVAGLTCWHKQEGQPVMTLCNDFFEFRRSLLVSILHRLCVSIAFVCLGISGVCSICSAEDSFRCNSSLVHIGDTQLDVLTSCGDPGHKKKAYDGYGEKELWTYNFGESSFIYVLVFRGNKLYGIESKGYGTYIPPAQKHALKGPEIKIVEWVAESGNPFTWVKGTVKNVGGAKARKVRVKARALDRYDNMVNMDEFLAKKYKLAPGEDSFFEIPIKSNPKTVKYDVSVSWEADL